MAAPTREQIETALSNALKDDMRMISAITIRGGKVGFMITVDPSQKDYGLKLKDKSEGAVAILNGVESVTAVVTAHDATPIPPKPQSGYDEPRVRAQWNLTSIAGVKRVIAIASGKGGVGKSTTTVNLAHTLTSQGKKVGILDADIYGPSIPHMLHLPNAQPEIQNNKMQPAQAYGIKIMSMALITGDQAAILRGPMISKSLQQMLRATAWGELDVLLVDMPPGTGDIHLSMAQQVPLTGAIIVTTPQSVATIDATKCAKMFQKLNVPILGVIENMNGEMFGVGGGKKLAEEFATPFLGSIPLQSEIRVAADKGDIPPSNVTAIYQEVAKALA